MSVIHQKPVALSHCATDLMSTLGHILNRAKRPDSAEKTGSFTPVKSSLVTAIYHCLVQHLHANARAPHEVGWHVICYARCADF